jgi:hypothetical protein
MMNMNKKYYLFAILKNIKHINSNSIINYYY